jgi:hypothetical protein
MRAVSYQSVFEGVLARVGIAPADADAGLSARLAEFISDRLRDAWEYYAWPETMATEERRFRAEWTAAIYAANAELYHAATDKYWKANATTAATDVPGVSTKWDELTAFYRYVEYEQPGETPIEAVLGAWDKDPRVDADARELPRSLTADGIVFPPGAWTSGAWTYTSVWIEFRRRPEDWTWKPYAAGTGNTAGDRVYVDGEIWLCLADTTAGNGPEDSPESWRQLEFPYCLARAVKAGAVADFLPSDAQNEKGQAAEPKFDALLDEQVWQLVKLQGQTGRPRMIPPR